MKKIDLGQPIATLANVGVLAGILLLVYELHQNRQLTAAQTRHDLSQAIIGQLANFVMDAELADLITRGELGTLTDQTEERRYELYLNMRMRYWEDVHYQYRLGLFDAAEFEATRETWVNTLSRPSVRKFWADWRTTYSPEFRAEIDKIVED